jgi:hypothetical protein
MALRGTHSARRGKEKRLALSKGRIKPYRERLISVSSIVEEWVLVHYAQFRVQQMAPSPRLLNSDRRPFTVGSLQAV